MPKYSRNLSDASAELVAQPPPYDDEETADEAELRSRIPDAEIADSKRRVLSRLLTVMTARNPELVDELPSMLERHHLVGVLEPHDKRSGPSGSSERAVSPDPTPAPEAINDAEHADDFDLVALRQRLRAGASSRVNVRRQSSVRAVTAMSQVSAGHRQ